MSQFSDQLAAAATEAQSILAPMVDPDANGTFTLAGVTNALDGTANLTGVMSIFDNVAVPTANGFEEQRQIKISATRDQFTAAPDAAARPRLTAKGEQWTLTAVEPGGQFYTLTAVAV